MRVGIDARGLLAGEKTGVDYYVWSLVHALAVQDNGLISYCTSTGRRANPGQRG